MPDIEKNPIQQEHQLHLPRVTYLAASHLSKADLASPLMTQASALEANFLSEMLGYSGVGATSESFGGGIGEDQFSSFLRDEEAKQMVAHGGIGLAEQLFRTMMKDNSNAG